MHNTVFTFGQHLGKTFDYVYSTDLTYLNWVVRLRNPRQKQMKEFQKYVIGRNSDAPLCKTCACYKKFVKYDTPDSSGVWACMECDTFEI